MLNSTVNARDSHFILVRALDRDRVIALRPVLLRWIDWSIVLQSFLCIFWCPRPLFINREGRGAITILVGSTEGVRNYIQKVLSIGIRLVWPILLRFGVAVAAPLLASVRGPGQGPRSVVALLGSPVGPASTSPRAFHG